MSVTSSALRDLSDLSVDEIRRVVVETATQRSELAPIAASLDRLFVAAQGRASLVDTLAGGPRASVDSEIDDLLVQARIAGEAKRSIWQEEMLTSSAVGELLGSKAGNLRELPRRLRVRSELLGLPHRRGTFYPAFQIDAAKRRVIPVVAEVNRLLDAAGDPWGVASWWVSENARLGARPMDLVTTQRAEDVRAAAEAVTEPLG